MINCSWDAEPFDAGRIQSTILGRRASLTETLQKQTWPACNEFRFRLDNVQSINHCWSNIIVVVIVKVLGASCCRVLRRCRLLGEQVSLFFFLIVGHPGLYCKRKTICSAPATAFPSFEISSHCARINSGQMNAVNLRLESAEPNSSGRHPSPI